MSDNIFVPLGQALFAVFGASIRWINTTDQPKTIKALLIEAASAAFFGMVVGYAVRAMNLSDELSFAFAGIAGHGGAGLYNIVVKRIINRFLPEDTTQPIEPIPQETNENSTQNFTT